MGRFPRARHAHEHGLVLLSQGAHYRIERTETGEFLLFAESGDPERLRDQLQLYQRECAYWPPVAPVLPESEVTIEAALVWIVLLLTAYTISLQKPEWVVAGRVDTEAMLAGEWYRAATALLLHADIGHLAGNMGFGAMFLFWLCRQVGTRAALLGTFIAGTVGNLLNVWIYYPEIHRSIGASTAVFGTVGMMAAFAIGAGLRMRSWRSLRVWTIPLVTGLILLGWFGAGENPRTDVSAHLTGFVAGLPIGFAIGWLKGARQKPGR